MAPIRCGHAIFSRSVVVFMTLSVFLLLGAGASADVVEPDFKPMEFQQTVDSHLDILQQAIETCDEELYNKTRRDLMRAFQMHDQDLSGQIADIRRQHDIPGDVDTVPEVNALVESEQAAVSGKGMGVDAKPERLQALNRLAGLIKQRNELKAIERRTVFPPYPDPCGERMEKAPAAVAPEAPQQPGSMEPSPKPMGKMAEPQQPSGAAKAEPMAAAPKAQPQEPAAMPMLGALAVELEAGVVEMDVPTSGFGTSTMGGVDSFAASSSDDLKGFTFGITLRSYLDGGLVDVPPVVAKPSIGLSFGYLTADESGDDLVAAGGPDTSFTLQEDFGGASSIDFGPAGMSVGLDEEYQRYTIELVYSHPCFQKENGLGTFTFFGNAGLGHYFADYDLDAFAEVPGMAGTFSNWRQEVETQRTYAIVGVELVQQLATNVALSLGGSFKPGYTDAKFDSDQRVMSSLAAPLDDFTLDADDEDSSWNYAFDADLRLNVAFTENFSGSVGIGYQYLNDFFHPDNRVGAADRGPNLETDDMDLWTGTIACTLRF